MAIEATWVCRRLFRQVVHDATNGYGGFGSFILNVNPSNQLRLVTSLRKDYYQIPYDPNPNDIENAPIPENDFMAQYPSIGCGMANMRAIAFVNFSWVHTFNSKTLLTVSPFCHYNSANYDRSPNDRRRSAKSFSVYLLGMAKSGPSGATILRVEQA